MPHVVVSLPIIVAFLVAFVASFTRIFSATKPFWGLFPAWLQVFAPQIVLALGAIAQGLAGGISSWTDLTVVFITAGALLLPGIPSHRSNAALPRNGGPKAPSVPPIAACLCLMLALCVVGCAFLKGTAWPVVKDCAPSSATLLTQVEDILLDGQDVDQKLKEAGSELGADGLALVVCAVEEFERKATANTPALGAARARAHAFLVETGNAS